MIYKQTAVYRYDLQTAVFFDQQHSTADWRVESAKMLFEEFYGLVAAPAVFSREQVELEVF